MEKLGIISIVWITLITYARHMYFCLEETSTFHKVLDLISLAAVIWLAVSFLL